MVASPEIRRLVSGMVEKLVRSYGPEKVVLFGSYAWGAPDTGSDIDLLVVKNTSERFIDRWTTVRRILSDRHRKVGLDVLVLTPGEVTERLSAGDPFVRQILDDGEVLYASRPSRSS
ncbi:MAG: nucleotidyltransferase domain-containing protein [Planctomycetes bacterium]|nr:nucleotidyltransferase domain-containing protein [Planctomycetota bacterium]